MNRRLVVIAALCVAILEAKGKNQQDILTAIKHERKRQDQQWGGLQHDEGHDNLTWVLLLAKHLGKLASVIRQPDERYYRDIRDSIIIIGHSAEDFV